MTEPNKPPAASPAAAPIAPYGAFAAQPVFFARAKAAPKRGPWWGAVVHEVWGWMKHQGFGVVLLCFFFGGFLYLSTRDDKQRLDALERRMIECEADRTALRQMIETLMKRNP